jgi:hypothetical protein
LLIGDKIDADVAADGDERLSAAMIPAVREPQSKPATIAFWILSASIKAMASTAIAACSPFRIVSSDRKRVVP